MFKRGFAKPFYVRGRRIHYTYIYSTVPGCYVMISALILLEYLQLVQGFDIWTRIGSIFVVVTMYIVVDFLGDRY